MKKMIYIYDAQEAIAPIISATAQESIRYRRFKMKDKSSVSFDGAWSHVRNSYQHTAVLIDLNSHKNISSAILFKDYRFLKGNYENDKPGNLMEIKALDLMSNELLDDLIISYTSDGDVKIKKVIEKLNRTTPLLNRKNPGHVYLSIIRTIKTLSTKNHNIFNPLIDSFLKFVKNKVLMINDADKRLKVYLNISSHYSGIHNEDLCMHNMESQNIQYFNSTNPVAKAIFDIF